MMRPTLTREKLSQQAEIAEQTRLFLQTGHSIQEIPSGISSVPVSIKHQWSQTTQMEKEKKLHKAPKH